jgi:hypothetical protein
LLDRLIKELLDLKRMTVRADSRTEQTWTEIDKGKGFFTMQRCDRQSSGVTPSVEVHRRAKKGWTRPNNQKESKPVSDDAPPAGRGAHDRQQNIVKSGQRDMYTHIYTEMQAGNMGQKERETCDDREKYLSFFSFVFT